MHISLRNIFLWLFLFFFGYAVASIWYAGYDLQDILHPSLGQQTQTYSWNILDAKKVREVYDFIEKNYYSFSTKDKKKLEDSFLEAMTTALGDKYTNYFNTVESKKFTDTLHGDFEWIGAVINENPKGIQIMKVLDGSPAIKSWLMAGDIIIAVGDKSVVWMSSEDAVNLIRWPKWSSVSIKYIEAKTKKEKTITIERDTVVVPTVVSELTKDKIGIIEMNIFGENTARDFQKQLDTLVSSGATSIILDLRNNGWGFLDAAVNIVSSVLPVNKVAVITKWTNPTENLTFYTQKTSKKYMQIPLVILINSMSASATEITAGALQDYNRALIVWEKSYGKGSVQTPFILSDGSMIKITTAKWFTPNMRWIDEKWIEPDVKIELTSDDYKNAHDRQMEGAKKLLKIQIQKKSSVKDLREIAKTLTF